MAFSEWAPWAVLVAAAVVFPLLVFIPAPYGRHYRPGWGPSMSARLSWVVMEAPSGGLFAIAWVGNPSFGDPVVLLLGGLYLAHYLERTLLFPLLMRGEGKRQPLLTIGMAIAFNVLNGWGNGAALSPRAVDARLVVGVALFVAGAAVNLHSDAVLRGLRGPGETGYKVPHGGLYRWVSAPNYLGELVEWVGFAVAAWTLPALAFAVFTFANLAPRARSHHRWYQAQFPDYPKERRALVPFLW